MDEYAQLVKDLRASGIIKDHKTGIFQSQKNSFSGKDFVDWVVKTKELGMLWTLKDYVTFFGHIKN